MKTKQLYFVYIFFLGFPILHALHAENKIQCPEMLSLPQRCTFCAVN